MDYLSVFPKKQKWEGLPVKMHKLEEGEGFRSVDVGSNWIGNVAFPGIRLWSKEQVTK